MSILKTLVPIFFVVSSFSVFASENSINFNNKKLKITNDVDYNLNAYSDDQMTPNDTPITSTKEFFWRNPSKSIININNKSPTAYNISISGISCRYFYQDISGNSAVVSTTYFNGNIATGNDTTLRSELSACVSQATCAVTLVAPGESTTFDVPMSLNKASCLKEWNLNVVLD